ncbi:hypothetical protein A3H75_02940 [Candidatus Uhrbacteria bacterium RIFCSPLOWO2_02_FULL_51_9]|uniref:Methyltransferase type 11 domain-containing protein n=1 Tax=Candidatus Uhrbacteria bacterium RIFCSPLOWO2_02_FULL_51_9 TaxID=1802410 RepID=A0A1F7VFA6_9BACT|nr:MAG: hypothetical protein A3H75_02940 [Candidatus Uhrbacteria bacterium RIFCSPLOWO2_02_FULL_51_9]
MSYRKFNTYATWDRAPFFALAKKYAEGKQTAVDIGPGDDGFARHLGRTDIHLLEGNPASYEQLKTHYPNARLYRAPDALPFADSTVDFIHLSHVVEHLENEPLYALLKELDRVCAPNGIIAISAPLAHPDFYNDLSHVRPYNPAVFLKYLVNGDATCVTRPLISTRYKKEELVFRHTPTELFPLRAFNNRVMRFCAYACRALAIKLGYRVYERTGFTLILKKTL